MAQDNILFVMGALNGEVEMAKTVLARLGFRYTAATKGGAYAKTRRDAHAADGLVKAPKGTPKLVFFDCNVQGYTAERIFEPLSSRPETNLHNPEFYWGNSPLGQLFSALIFDPLFGGGKKAAEQLADSTWEARLAAAAQHYLCDAYQGRCPGVSPVALRLWRAIERASIKKMDVQELMDEDAQAIGLLKSLPVREINGHCFIEAVNPEFQVKEAAAIIGMPVMLTMNTDREQRKKVLLVGASGSALGAWVRWAQSDGSGFAKVYGGVEKGYAVGYLDKN